MHSVYKCTFHCITSKISGFGILSIRFSPTAKITELTLIGECSVVIRPRVQGHSSPTEQSGSCRQK